MKSRSFPPVFQMKLSLIYFCLALVFLPILSCNKEKDQAQPVKELTGAQTSYFPGEIAVLSLVNGKLDDGTYSGSFNGKAIDWIVVNNQAVVRIPALSEGIYQAELTFSGEVIKFNAKIKAAPLVRPAEDYLNESIERSISIKETVSILSGKMDTAKAQSFAQEAIERQAVRDSMQIAFDALTPEEKADFAQFMSVNEHHLIEMQSAVQDLSAAFSKLNRPAGAVENYEVTINAAIAKFIHASVKASINIPMIAAFAKIGVTSAFAGPGGWLISSGALLGCLYFMVDFIEEVQAVGAATGVLLNTAFVPFSGLDADVKQFKANVALVNNISCLYRSIYIGDKTAAPNGNIKLVVEAIINLYNSTLDILPKLPPRFRPKVSITSLDDLPNFFTKRRSVYNNYLEIDPSTSDPSIKVFRFSNADGSTSLNFTGSSLTDKNITYKLRYLNSNYVPSFEKTMNAKVIFECPATVTDIDGNVYNTVKIGDQCWMKENLKVSRYQNETVIPNISEDVAWCENKTGAVACLNNEPEWCNSLSGKYYNYYAVINENKLCPTGWRIPTVEDWSILINFLGGSDVAGTKMKVPEGWDALPVGTNESGFSGIGAGLRYGSEVNGYFDLYNHRGIWWSSNKSDWISGQFSSIMLSCGWPGTQVVPKAPDSGLSVRCILD